MPEWIGMDKDHVEPATMGWIMGKDGAAGGMGHDDGWGMMELPLIAVIYQE